MRIAYNPKTAAALSQAPANDDITFDLSGLSIYVKGVRFKGTDTTYSVFKKHDENGGGYDGLVPAPDYNSGIFNRFLREDGTWQYIASSSDINVYQSEDDNSDFRPVILGLTHSANITELVNPVTGQVYVTAKIYACPSTGVLYATKLFSNGKEVLTEHLSLLNYVTLHTPQTITGKKTFYLLVNTGNGDSNDDGTLYTRSLIYMDSSKNMIYSDTKANTIIRGGVIKVLNSNGVDSVLFTPENAYFTTRITSEKTISGSLLMSTTIDSPPLIVKSPIVVQNLNADLLDGKHAIMKFSEASEIDWSSLLWYANGAITDVPSMSYATVFNPGNVDYFRGWQIWNSRSNPVLFWRPSNLDGTAWDTEHILIDNLNIGLYNAGSASKLNPGRYLWGNFFDGTTDIDGALYVAGRMVSMTMDPEPYGLTSSSRGIYHPKGTGLTLSSLKTTNSNKESSYLVHIHCRTTEGEINNVYFGGVNSGLTNGAANFVIGRRTGVTSWAESLRINQSGNVGINTISPMHKLLVDGAGVFSNTNSTTYNTNGITIGAGDITSRYITCYGKTAASYINIGYSASINNCGELSFYYAGNNNTSNYVLMGLYGALNWLCLYPSSAKLNSSLEIYSTGNSFNEGVRIHSASNNWSGIVFCSLDNKASSGTSTNTWGIHNNEGKLYINKNNSNGITPNILCNVNDNWGMGTNNPILKLHVIGNGFFSGNVSAANRGFSTPSDAAIEVREYVRAGSDISIAPLNKFMYAPRIGFHWGNRWWNNLIMYDNAFRFMDYNAINYVDVFAKWFKSTGDTGWYNNSYGGGIYMSDSTWIRIYNDKKFYVSNSASDSIYTAGGFQSAVTSGAVLSTLYNGTWYRDTIQTHGNGNLSISAPGGSLFLSYYRGNTYFGGSTYFINRDGYFNGSCSYATSAGSADSAKKLIYTGTNTNCFTVYLGGGSYMGRSGWATYLIGNHGNGSTYYSLTIALPFWGPPIYRRLEKGTDKGWKAFCTAENTYVSGSKGYILNTEITYVNNSGYASGSGASHHLYTHYNGGQLVNPQTYFNNGIGVKVAMTGLSSKGTSYWSDTLWINGYAGGDVPYMCALHFNRDGSPRMWMSVLKHTDTAYGGLYEVLTTYNRTWWKVGDADSVDGQHFNWNNNSNTHTYLWAASSNGLAYLVHRASISVNYANSSGYASSAGNSDTVDGYHATTFTKGDSTHPVVIASGWIKNNGSGTWSWGGGCVRSGVSISVSRSGARLAVVASGATVTSAHANLENSNAVSGNSTADVSGRSMGMYWITTYCSSNTVYLRVASLGNADNDTWYTNSNMLISASRYISSITITLFGYVN